MSMFDDVLGDSALKVPNSEGAMETRSTVMERVLDFVG